MEPSIARKGIKDSEKVYQIFQQLLSTVGKGNLMYDKKIDANPASVHVKCEENNQKVAEILESLKKALADTKECYQHCQKEMATAKMPSIEDIAKGNTKKEPADEPSEEYKTLKKQLQAKNEDLRVIIDEVRHIFSDINQLSTTVPY